MTLDAEVPRAPVCPLHRPTPARRLRAALAGGVVPLMLIAAAPSQAAEALTHTVRPGDTLGEIAHAHGVPLEQVFALNGMDARTVIHPGDVIRLRGTTAAPAPAPTTPAARTYTVRAGDGWWVVAHRTGVAAATLQSLNGMSASTMLHPGMVLKLSAGTSAAPAPTPAPAPTAPAAGTYTVQAGDGWWVIAHRTGVAAATLQSLNGMSASTMLHPGMVLRTSGTAAPAPATPAPSTPAPAPTTPPPTTPPPTTPANGPVVRYTVVSGDSLWGISQRFEVSIPQIRALNGLTTASVLQPGQVLVISDGTLAPAPVAGEQPIGSTFLHYTYPPHVTASANENYRLLQSMPLPSPEQMRQIVRETALRMGVDPRLALAHAYTESHFRMGAVSPANAIGAMQVIPITGEFASQLVGRELNLLDPYDNATAGVAYIKHIQARTPTLELGIGAYYQGLGGVLSQGPRADTRDYIAKVKSAMAMF